MKTRAAIVVAIAATLCAGAAGADDHLFQAMQHGLGKKSADQHPFVSNKNDHSGDEANGQGSPFTGDDMQTPATDSENANLHANIRPMPGAAPFLCGPQNLGDRDAFLFRISPPEPGDRPCAE